MEQNEIYKKMQLANNVALAHWIRSEELECQFMVGFERPQDYTLAVWFRTQCNAEAVTLDAFIERWTPPVGQYKNWAVIISTLKMVPLVKRKNSRGIIVGARAGSESGEWIPFLGRIMHHMGFSGSVEMWDKGLRPEEVTYQDIIITSHEGYYNGKGPSFTWGVDDIWYGGAGPAIRRAEYESFKDQSKQAQPFFHVSEGRTFFSASKTEVPQFVWEPGMCACPRCSFERTLSPMEQNTMRFFDSRCHPGPHKHIREVLKELETQGYFAPTLRSQQVAATLVAVEHSLASVAGAIVNKPGEVIIRDSLLDGPKVNLKSAPDHYSTNPAEGGTFSGYHDVNRSASLEYVADVASEIYYLPAGYYPEFTETSLLKEGKIGYRKKILPPTVPKKEEVKIRQKDVFGRVFFGPNGLEGMWCWRERKMVPVPHICPGLDPRSRVYEWKGWKTRFYHRDREAKDLCPECDRTISSYMHKCPKKFCLLGISDKKNKGVKEVLQRELERALAGQDLYDGIFGVPPAVERSKELVGIHFDFPEV